MSGLTDSLFSTPALAALFTDAALVARMAAFEAALAQAQAEAGVIPPTAAAAIGAGASAAFDVDALCGEAVRSGTLAVPFVQALTRIVQARDPMAASFVHFGATSQDVLDTAFVLQAKAALTLIEADLERAITAAAGIAREHRGAIMLGRTLMQPATPITFGLKAAQWLAGLLDAGEALRFAAGRALKLQFGGAAGTLGALGVHGPQVARRLALALDLPPGDLPWHARRGPLAELCAALAILAGVCGKAARDIALMAQAEVGEAFEGAEPGRGGSSAMPHKRNPVRAMQILANAARAPHLAASIMAGLPQEHERALGGWQAEWAVAPELFKLAGGSAAQLAALLATLDVRADRMRANFDALGGLPMTEAVALMLAPKLGKLEAQAIVEMAARATGPGLTLGEALRADPRVTEAASQADLSRALDPDLALGCAQAFIDAALARVR